MSSSDEVLLVVNVVPNIGFDYHASSSGPNPCVCCRALYTPFHYLLCSSRCNNAYEELSCLIAQVVEFATKLRGTDGMPLVRAAWISAKSPPPQLLPHIVVSTPSALIRGSQDFPVAYGHFWSLGSIVNRYAGQLSPQSDSCNKFWPLRALFDAVFTAIT